jgi:hypothetical protein
MRIPTQLPEISTPFCRAEGAHFQIGVIVPDHRLPPTVAVPLDLHDPFVCRNEAAGIHIPPARHNCVTQTGERKKRTLNFLDRWAGS